MPDFKDVLPLDRIPPGKSTTVEVDGKTVALFNVDGTIHAIADACLHAGQSLGYGILQGKVVRCRAHGWRYDVTTGEIVGVPGSGVACYQARVENGQVQVAVA
ncbi:Rieske (2Fe-2S) protein [Neotabrizicola shimadae]|uniref:Rieske (2Fe-2S) protein n=1 Tax=Neotabrizicola shimadae TaxID=2807096 RepID=A0A8G0ZTT6_9RHOB|nr:Rieske (2Fe-2S) protein [Neotabrizicola shimadae]QYZ69993.1 Rieske (2Fe-2S) protein [Neotabrizicola shimadae]